MRAATAVIAAVLSCTAAHAQVSPGSGKPEALDVPAPVVPGGSIDVQILPGQAPTLRIANPLFVRAYAVTGTSSLSEAEIAELLAPWTGRVVGADEIAEAAAALTRRVRAKGYPVALAHVPPQTLRGEVVEIIVTEGIVGGIKLKLADDLRVSRATVERFVEDIRPGDPIRTDNFERSLLLLNDLPGVRVGASLRPGSAPGTVDLDARVENDAPINGSLVIDNAGVRAAGKYRADATVRLRSPLGIGDLASVRYLDSSAGGQALLSFTYGLPVNGAGTRLGVRHSEQRYRLRKEFFALQAHGESRGTSLLASHPLVRASDRNFVLSLSYTEIEFHDFLDAVGFVSDSRQRIAGIGLAADRRDGWLGGGISGLQAQLLQGELIAGAGTPNPSGHFSVLRARVQRLQRTTARSSVLASLQVQRASTGLDPGTELALGGPDAVRAYPPAELYADEGAIARLDYRYALVPERTAVTLFFDTARAKVSRDPLPGDPANRRSLNGYGIGLYHALSHGIVLHASAAWRATGSAASEPDRSPRLWIALSAEF